MLFTLGRMDVLSPGEAQLDERRGACLGGARLRGDVQLFDHGQKSVKRHPRAKVACDQSCIVHTCYRLIPMLKWLRNPSCSGAKHASNISGNAVATS